MRACMRKVQFKRFHGGRGGSHNDGKTKKQPADCFPQLGQNKFKITNKYK